MRSVILTNPHPIPTQSSPPHHQILSQLLESQFPEVPWFEREITPDNKGLSGGLNLDGL